mgnify:CR=1 FL=1
MVVANFAPWGQPVVFVMNHWKSRYGARAAAYSARAIEARALRRELDRRLANDPAAAIVVAGDFNDDIDDAIPQACAGFALDEHAVLADGLLLYNLSASLPPSKRGSYYYNKENRWNSFDFMCVSRGLLRKGKPMSAWVVKRDSYEIFVLEKMRMNKGAPLPFRRLYTKQGVLNYTGYSDHFPVRLMLEFRP